jgi:hypothetical protein
VWVLVGTPPLLGVGNIWHDGRLELPLDCELEHFPDLEINSETSALIKAGLNFDEKEFFPPSIGAPIVDVHVKLTHDFHRILTHPFYA